MEIKLKEPLYSIFKAACETPDVTDILISPESTRIRVSGELQPLGCQNAQPSDITDLLEEWLSSEEWNILQEKLSLDKSMEFEGKRFRVHLYRSRGRWVMAVRRLRISIPRFSTLGFKEDIFFRFFNSVRSGLVLVSGPNSMGKTTTIASAIEEINLREGCHIITIEDPIEYIFTNKKAQIDQREVGSDTPSFAQGIKDAARANPNIIFLGEMRDPESAEIALQASEMGCLVISTIHSPSSIDTISRVISLFPEDKKSNIRSQLSQYLHGIINQRLVTIVNPDGREEKQLLFEPILAVKSAKSLIQQDKDKQLVNVIRDQGYTSLKDQIKLLLTEGKISLQVAAHLSPEPLY